MIRRRRGRRLFNQVEPVADGYRTTSWETSFTPTLEDVRTVRWLLASKPACSGAYLPNELVLTILDLARYHPITSSERKENSQLASHKPPYCYTGLYLVSGPVPIPKTGETLKIFDVRFTIQSRDQGWTTEANKSKCLFTSFSRILPCTHLENPKTCKIHGLFHDPKSLCIYLYFHCGSTRKSSHSTLSPGACDRRQQGL